MLSEGLKKNTRWMISLFSLFRVTRQLITTSYRRWGLDTISLVRGRRGTISKSDLQNGQILFCACVFADKPQEDETGTCG